MARTVFRCIDCKTIKPILGANDPGYCGGTGYATTKRGRVCYTCCAERDKREMERTGRIVLYLTHDPNGGYFVTNWPGTMKIAPDRYKKGAHNIAHTRVDVWFRDHTGAEWHGVQIGEMSQILRCTRLTA